VEQPPERFGNIDTLINNPESSSMVNAITIIARFGPTV
jgi:hypothetical protein